MTRRAAAVLILALGSVSAGQTPKTFVGTISDSMCATDGHAAMRMGPTDADCTRMCVLAHGADYVLVVGEAAYVLSDPAAAEKFAGQRVRVAGELDAAAKILRVQSITAAD
jgi:hypothetical protein